MKDLATLRNPACSISLGEQNGVCICLFVSIIHLLDFMSRIVFREAWHKLGSSVTKEVAMSRYIELVGKVDPEWETQPLDTSQQQVRLE